MVMSICFFLSRCACFAFFFVTRKLKSTLSSASTWRFGLVGLLFTDDRRLPTANALLLLQLLLVAKGQSYFTKETPFRYNNGEISNIIPRYDVVEIWVVEEEAVLVCSWRKDRYYHPPMVGS